MNPQKITLENLKARMKVFLDFPQVEDSLQDDIERTVNQIMLPKVQNGGRPPLDVMTDYLNAGQDSKGRLKLGLIYLMPQIITRYSRFRQIAQ